MRNDLTTAFQTAMAANGRAPVQLAVFHFSAGDVFLSDREIGPADGLADTYAGLIEEWGALEDLAAGDPGELSAEIRQMGLAVWNGGAPPFSDHFLREDPENVRVDVYQWFAGLDDSDKALIDTFIIADPIAFDERQRLVRLDLVSLAANFDQRAGDLLTAAAWPAAKTDDLGKPIDFCFGNCGRVPTLCAKTAPAATLNGSILAGTMTIAVHEDLDALAFPAAGTLQIGEELIRYASRTAGAFTVSQRGYLTEAAEHLDRDAIVAKIDDHTYIIGRGPMGEISGVQVGGFDAPPAIYTVEAALDPARVIFSEKPYAFHFAAGSTFLEMQFDTLGIGNTAIQPHLAYDAANGATAAEINENARVLALSQTTVNADKGAIVKAYLAVEHWESAAFVYDHAEVWVEGIGTVGWLSRPNIADTISIEAEVDLDHGHTHAIGGEHTHNFHDPALQTIEEPHTHTTTTSGNVLTTYPDPDNQSFRLYANYEPGSSGETRSFWFPDSSPSHDSATLKFRTDLAGAHLRVNYYFDASATMNSMHMGERIADNPVHVTFQAIGAGVAGGSCYVWDISLDQILDSNINPTGTGANTRVSVSGRNDAIASDKKPDDVADLATANQAIQVTNVEKSTRTHVNLYDITAHVNFDWNWFSGRDIKIYYVGINDNQSVYILHTFFDVEYRRRERLYSDEVTATVAAGLVDDGGAAIDRADGVAQYLLTQCGGIDAGRIDAGTWAAAGARLAAEGYRVDGKLAGDLTTKEALKAVLFQSRCRLFYGGGLAKLAFSEKLNDWPAGRAITADDYQAQSMAIERQAARAIVNTVNLYHARDYTSDADGPAAFARCATAASIESQARHGVRADDDKFCFDLVRDPDQAASLARYYADRYAWPSSYINFSGYLPLFGLEKDDYLSLTAEFYRMRKTKARVIGAARIFGSGKLNRINHIRILAECLRYLLIEYSAADTVAAMDALAVSLGFDVYSIDQVHVADGFTAGVGVNPAEAITVGDALASVAAFALAHAETVTAADALALTVGVNVTDTTAVLDDAVAWRTFGYGGGSYGWGGYGGAVIWTNRAPDTIQPGIVLYTAMAPAASEETVTAGEELIFSCGYGCPLGSGYGRGFYGQ